MGDNSDWDSGPPESRILHFFPGWGELVWRVNGRTVVKGHAWGGKDPEPGETLKTMVPRKTTPGHYVIHWSGAYVTQTWETSRIAWGTPLRLSVDGTDLLYATGSHPAWASALKTAKLKLAEVKDLYHGLYGDSKLYDPDNDGIPDQWVFNDFGPIAIRYFRDLNGNKKKDAGEKLSGEMFHTTPGSEAAKARGLPHELTSSHGCIHISPRDRERFTKAGAFARGVDLVIHSYTETMPAEWR